eukprot:506851-Prorocentrum_lima.AAC.1
MAAWGRSVLLKCRVKVRELLEVPKGCTQGATERAVMILARFLLKQLTYQDKENVKEQKWPEWLTAEWCEAPSL